MKKFSLFSGACLAGLAVAIGAFGAHAWNGYLREINRLETFQTAAQYQMYAGLTLLLLGIWQIQVSNKLLKSAGYVIFTGSLIFSGSLYLICITQLTIWGAFAPIGGLLLISGFAMMAYSALKN